MGKVYKFYETELQHSGASAKPKFMYIDVLPEQEGELTYNGEEQYPAWKNLDPLKLLIEGEKSATDAGTHKITVTPMGNFAWPDNTQTPREIEYIIQRKKLSAVPSQKNTLTYNTQNQTPTWYNYNSNELTIGGTYQNQSGAGEYSATFTPTSNYCWSDGTYAAKTVKWTIGKLKLTKPSATQSSYNYSGSSISVSVSDYNSTYMTQGGTTTATAIGNYSATYTLKSTTNTTWSDGSTGVVTVTWSIAEVKVTKPTANTQSFTYHGDPQEPSWNNYNSSYMTKSGDGAQVNAGSYSTTFTLKSGYKWTDGTTSDVKIDWKINKLKIAKPKAGYSDLKPYQYEGDVLGNSPSINMGLYYDPSDEYWAFYDWYDYNEASQASLNELFRNMEVSAGNNYFTLKPKVKLLDTDNTTWSDDSTTPVTLSFKVYKKEIDPPALNFGYICSQTSDYCFNFGNGIWAPTAEKVDDYNVNMQWTAQARVYWENLTFCEYDTLAIALDTSNANIPESWAGSSTITRYITAKLNDNAKNYCVFRGKTTSNTEIRYNFKISKLEVLLPHWSNAVAPYWDSSEGRPQFSKSQQGLNFIESLEVVPQQFKKMVDVGFIKNDSSGWDIGVCRESWTAQSPYSGWLNFVETTDPYQGTHVGSTYVYLTFRLVA